MATEKFCLRWNEFEANISVAFRELRDSSDFFDVTLVCDDRQVQAHKVILSACSPFFRTVLRRNPHAHPLLYLKGVRQTELKAILDFMYHGEVNVAQENLNSFLSVAEDLKVKGLTQNPTEKSPPLSSSRSSGSSLPPRKHSTQSQPQLNEHINDEFQSSSQKEAKKEEVSESSKESEENMVKNEPDDLNNQSLSSSSSLMLYQDLDEDGKVDEEGQYYDAASRGHKQRLIEYVEKVEQDGVVAYKCGICYKTSTRRDALTSHIENIHFPGAYKCYFCELVFNSQNTRNVHIGRKHKIN